MNTREENAAEAAREEAERLERQRLRARYVLWAMQWRHGNVHCPRCQADRFERVNLSSDENGLVETYACKVPECGARWKVELRESAVAVLQDDLEDEDWIDYSELDARERTGTTTPVTAENPDLVMSETRGPDR
jgi:hypothetical protein